MSKKQVFLSQWDYIVNCNENNNEKNDHINKTKINHPRPKHRDRYKKYSMSQ